jgi:hypothetical protein
MRKGSASADPILHLLSQGLRHRDPLVRRWAENLMRGDHVARAKVRPRRRKSQADVK